VSEPLAGSLEILLKNLGFARGNPFASVEAGKEEGQDWFYESFVEPPRFDEIVGDARFPQPMLIFAPRGSGKTALRVMVNYYCRRGYANLQGWVPGGKVLSILHTDLSLIQEVARENPEADLARSHVQTIVRAGVVALARQLGNDPSFRGRLASQPAEDKTYLHWFVSHFGEDLVAAEWQWLREAGLAARLSLGFPLPRPSGETTALPAFEYLPDLQSLLASESSHSYVQLMRRFVELALSVSFQAVYVLVDGADELATTASEFGYAARLVEALAANLRILDMPGVAFRLFLPAEMRPFLEALGSVRDDRIVWYDLVWKPDQLLALLRKRLDVFSEGRVPSLDTICADDLPPGQLEKAMVEAADGSPRTLLRLGQALLRRQAELVRGDERADALLRKEAWERARADILPHQEQPPAAIQTTAPEAEQPPAWSRILTGYPSPIALVCRDYLIRQEPMAHLVRLLDAFEATVSFCGVLMLAQYRRQVAEAANQGQRARSLQSAVGKECRQMTLGRWLWVLERLTGLSGSLGRTLIGSQLHRLIHGESGAAMRRLRDLRNELAHQAKPPAFYAEQSAAAHADLLTVLTGLDFLAETALFQPLNLQRRGDEYLHLVRRYQGDNPLFTEGRWSLTIPLDCDRLWFSQGNRVLALFPLLLAERCPECGHDEVFTYQRLEDDNLIYHNFASGHSLPTVHSRTAFTDLFGF
jgi:hypothetical protein